MSALLLCSIKKIILGTVQPNGDLNSRQQSCISYMWSIGMCHTKPHYKVKETACFILLYYDNMFVASYTHAHSIAIVCYSYIATYSHKLSYNKVSPSKYTNDHKVYNVYII